jgi:LysR family transcriptional regulator, regulator of abg operon
MQAHASLTYVIALANSDLLMMLPVQWTSFLPMRDMVQAIEVREVLPAPAICLVKRNGLPLTPAAEFFCDVMRRAVLHLQKT